MGSDQQRAARLANPDDADEVARLLHDFNVELDCHDVTATVMVVETPVRWLRSRV